MINTIISWCVESDLCLFLVGGTLGVVTFWLVFQPEMGDD